MNSGSSHVFHLPIFFCCLESRVLEGRCPCLGCRAWHLSLTPCLPLPLAAPCPQVQALLHLARQNRAVARTAQNERSSRSHSVFQLQISGEHAARGLQCIAPLSLVDLAGSERLDSGLALGPGERERLRETQSINSSLSTLGLVIMALSNKVGIGGGTTGGIWELATPNPTPAPSPVLLYPPGAPCALPEQQAHLPAAELSGWQR